MGHSVLLWDMPDEEDYQSRPRGGNFDTRYPRGYRGSTL